MSTPSVPRAGSRRSTSRLVGPRFVALALGLVLAVFAAFAWNAWSPRPASPVPQFDRKAVNALLLQRSRAPADAPRPVLAAGDPRGRPWWIPEADARLLFAVSTRGQRYDPWTYHAAIPNLDQEVSWPEHAGGRFRYRTNALSLREDAEVPAQRGDLRVLVAGDSHTAGFCDNAESFSNLLEAWLARRFPGKTVDVVNAANMGFSFHNYLGTLEKYRDLRPHVFLVVVHGGNDFQEVLVPHRYLHRLAPRPEDDSLLGRRHSAELRFPAAMFQGVWSMASFRAYPEDRALALDAASEVLARIRAICAEDGIRLVVALIPSPIEAESDAHAEKVLPVLALFQMSRADVVQHGELGRELLRRLAREAVPCLDGLEALREPGEPSFWRQDLHLSVAGHERMARALEPLVVEASGLGG